MSSSNKLHAKLNFFLHPLLQAVLKLPIAITGLAEAQIWQHYLSPSTCIQTGNYSGRDYYRALLPSASMQWWVPAKRRHQ